MRDIELIRKDKASQYFEKYIPSEFRTNKDFFCEILVEYFKSRPENLAYYFDLKNATGSNLDILAFNFFSLKRNFNNISLTDNELIMLLNFAILLEAKTILSAISLNQSLKSIFGDLVKAKASANLLEIFISKDSISNNVKEALFFYDLIPKPTGAKINIYYTSEMTKIFTTPIGSFYQYNSFEGGLCEINEVASKYLDENNKITIL